MTGPDRPTTAGLYDYFLGGTNGRPADRAAAEKLQAAVPEIADAVRANRAFHGRAVRWMAGQGIGQFIDIGSGLPTQHNTHQVAHEVARYMAAVAAGSYLALSHGTYDEMHTGKLQASRDVYANSASGVHLRSRAEVERFFDGLDLVPHRPGAVPALAYVSRWGVPKQEVTDSEGARGVYCGVARRP
jgi:hypothetical protein